MIAIVAFIFRYFLARWRFKKKKFKTAPGIFIPLTPFDPASFIVKGVGGGGGGSGFMKEKNENS